MAADLALPGLPAPFNYDWNGVYFGGHVGYGRGTTDVTLTEPVLSPVQQGFGSLYGGIQAGYNRLFGPHLLLGIETSVSFANAAPSDNVVWIGGTTQSAVIEKIDYVTTLRGRAGYAVSNWLLYGTGGFAWSASHVSRQALGSDIVEEHPAMRSGFTVGAGIETAFERRWTARVEYLYSRFGTLATDFFPLTHYASTLDLHMVRLGANYRFADGDGKVDSTIEVGKAPEFPTWELHAQSTFVYQGYPSFPALYSGANSLSPNAQAKETWSSSAFVGLRLWQGGELYYNPELLQGFGLSDTVGAGGYPNGEAQKSGFPYPRYNTSRLFLRQTMGFGGEQEDVEGAYGQLSGKRDVSRLTIQLGKMSVKDTFDNNTYAGDSRVNFLNWAMWAPGAFDYAADKVGLTYGITAELNQKNWAVRAGYFLVPDSSNANNFDAAVFKRGEYVAELETRYSIFSQPGRFRAAAWFNSVFSGEYRDALLLVALNPGLDPTDALMQDRAGRIKYGYYFNLEQAITDDIGLFARWSWNDGKNEIMAFTDIDSSLSAGAAVKGKAWGRPDDVFAIGGAINGLSRDHRDYLAAGGLSILIGDGQLNYRHETVFETYYALKLVKDVTFTADYQYLVNPAYNADRGPVHIFSGRLHAEL